MTSERERRELDAAIRRVVARNACIGCGLCTRLDPSLALELDAEGFLRPHRTGTGGSVAEGAARTFEQACPGCRVDGRSSFAGAGGTRPWVRTSAYGRRGRATRRCGSAEAAAVP